MSETPGVRRRIAVGVTGASGAIYAVRTMAALLEIGCELEVVFSPYQRASNTTGLRGLGLGLAGARDLLRQVGGDLTVESEEGGGSTFTMRLPVS